MSSIRIITDSASDFDKDGFIPENVTVLPLTIRFGEEEYLDGINISHGEFFEKLETSVELPSTSLVSPIAFEEAFRKAVDAGEDVVAVTLSSKLSGTYQSAVLAARNFEGHVTVVDSCNATLGEQILVRYASDLASAGKDMTEIADALENIKKKIHTMGIPETLEYLKKGGRISAISASLGGLLSIKPVLAVRNGEIIALGKARGPKNGCNYLIKEIEASAGIDFEKPFCVGYTGLSDAFLQTYIAASRSLYEGHEDQLLVSTVGATIGTHVGPNAIVVAFFEL